MSITNGIVSTKIYDKRDDFNFEIVNFPFLDGDVPWSLSYGVYISQLIRFARVCSSVDDFNGRNTCLTSIQPVEKITYGDNSTKRYRNILRHGLELKWINYYKHHIRLVLMIISTMRVTFLDYLILMGFFLF